MGNKLRTIILEPRIVECLFGCLAVYIHVMSSIPSFARLYDQSNYDRYTWTPAFTPNASSVTPFILVPHRSSDISLQHSFYKSATPFKFVSFVQ